MLFHALKRLLDISLALLGLIMLFPVLFAIAILITSKLGWPVFFTQQRPGLNENPFRMIKFRTMTNAKDSNGNLLPNEKRIARLGKFLRSTSLDELPELFNVLKGDMSLVGPRPLLMEYLPRYNAFQKAPSRSASWNHGLGTSQRPQYHKLGTKVRTRCLVRG